MNKNKNTSSSFQQSSPESLSGLSLRSSASTHSSYPSNPAHTQYFTITAPASAQLKIKASRFIALASSVSDIDQANTFLNHIKNKYYDATHHSYAYRLGHSGLQFKSSDDGEPSGSAGKPILFAINKFSLSDIIVVVARYFGGTKLGRAPLARAYSQVVVDLLSHCDIKPILNTVSIKIFCTYDDYSLLKNLINEYAVKKHEEFTDVVHIFADIPLIMLSKFTDTISSLTKGRAGLLLQ